MKTSSDDRAKLQKAYKLLQEVELVAWLYDWSAEQESDLAEALSRLSFLIDSLTPANHKDEQIAEMLIKAAQS